jgi:D-arginine dehydrogenase
MTDTDQIFDIAVIGAGIAGASLSYFASENARVLLLEREAQPRMHSTGRSAAMFMESYGSTQVRALTRASRLFLDSPPPGFCANPLISPRGALYIGTPEQVDAVTSLHTELMAEGCPARLMRRDEMLAMVPVLRSDKVGLGVLDPAAADVDVHSLHRGFLRGARSRGARLVCDAPVQRLHHDNGIWTVVAGGQGWRARQIVNAAGAWVDEVARLAGASPLGIEPKRRSAFVFDAPAGVRISGWPGVAAVDEAMYFKPDAGLLLGNDLPQAVRDQGLTAHSLAPGRSTGV